MWNLQTTPLRWLGIAALALFADCAAGNYEIADCDGAASNLATDVCNKFNTDPNDCMPYQCDRPSGRCIQTARDWDRDGYPDSRCGGSDCDDRDPKITGAMDGACSCTITGMICSAGQGACKRYSKYVCQNNFAICPALESQPSDWNTSPYADPPNSYTSEDWNCDGTVERACCYVNANGTKICGQCVQSASLCTSDVNTVCRNFCSGMNFDAGACNAANNKLFTCNASQCGSRVAICSCRYGFGCGVTVATEDKLNCR